MLERSGPFRAPNYSNARRKSKLNLRVSQQVSTLGVRLSLQINKTTSIDYFNTVMKETSEPPWGRLKLTESQE